MEILWLKSAIAMRLAQLDYIAADNPTAAIELDQRIDQQIDRLADHPRMGRAGRVRGTREMIITRTPFIAIYRIKANRIEILRIVHGAQQWPQPAKRRDRRLT